jgi:single-stranded DNA-binding protein
MTTKLPKSLRMKIKAHTAASRPIYGVSCGHLMAKVTVSQGAHLYIEGKLQTTSWEDRQSAAKKYRTEIVASDLVLLGSREKGNAAQPAGSDKAERAKPTAQAGGAPQVSDDDLPF